MPSRHKEEKNHEFKSVKYLLTSTMRTLLLIILYNEDKTLNEMRDELKKPSATILHGLKELQTHNLIKKEKKVYSLTSNGYLLATNIIKLINNWYAIDKNKVFWNDHDLSSIPKNFLNKIYLLRNAELISSTTDNLSNTFNTYIKLLEESNNLTIILPIYSENHFRHLIDIIKNKKIINLKLLINADILKSMHKNKYIKKSLIENDKVTIIKTNKSQKIFLTYSEEFMSLTLFFNDGHYDDSQILIDKSEDAIRWANDLFNEYKEEK